MKLAGILLAAFSFVVRIPGLYDTSYQWRPLHTEMTAYWFVREGINLLHYQTPFFGPPWQIPIEFPLFQALAALIFQAGLGNFDFACRLTALLCFYLSAVFLYLLCRKIFRDDRTVFVILLLYLLLPVNIYYSTEPLLDYLALGLALAYLYFILRWLDTRSSLRESLLATICGSLAVLVKPTTMPIVAMPILVFVVRDILAVFGKDAQPMSLHNRVKNIWARRSYWLTLGMMAVVPAFLGIMWTRHTDLIKEGSVFTQWHTSEAMMNWYFGTWSLRAELNVWFDRIYEAQRLFLPYGLSLFAVPGLLIAANLIPIPEETTGARLFVLAALASLGITLAIFLSLYQQQYYYVSFSASMAILGGYGVVRSWQLILSKKRILAFVFAIWGIIFLAGNGKDFSMHRASANSENRKVERSMARAQRVQQYVPPDQWVVVVADDWNPAYVFPLERKAMVVSPRELGKPVCQVLAAERFALVVVADRSYERNEELLEYTFRCFKSREEVLPGVFRVHH